MPPGIGARHATRCRAARGARPRRARATGRRVTVNDRIIVDMTMITRHVDARHHHHDHDHHHGIDDGRCCPRLHGYGALWRLRHRSSAQEKLAPGGGLAWLHCVWPSASEPTRVPRKRQERPPGHAPAVSEQQFVDDLRRELERASKAVPRSVWKASDACRDVARAGTKKACADVRDLRDAVEMAEQTRSRGGNPPWHPQMLANRPSWTKRSQQRVNWLA